MMQITRNQLFVNVLACPKWCRLPETNLQVYHKNKNGPGQKYLYVDEFHWTWPTTVNVLLRGNELGKAEWKVLMSHSNQRKSPIREKISQIYKFPFTTELWFALFDSWQCSLMSYTAICVNSNLLILHCKEFYAVSSLWCNRQLIARAED